MTKTNFKNKNFILIEITNSKTTISISVFTVISAFSRNLDFFSKTLDQQIEISGKTRNFVEKMEIFVLSIEIPIKIKF